MILCTADSQVTSPDSSARTRDTESALATRLPRRFHRVWFGPAPIPAAYERYWKIWQRLYPGCSFTTWRDADIESLTHTRHKIAEARSYAGKSDIARIEIIFRFGGIYLDCDMMPLRPFDFWSLRPALLVCHEQPPDSSTDQDACSTGFFAAPPGHPVLGQAIESLSALPLNRQAPNIETGPSFFGRMIRSRDVVRLPTAMFYPFSGQEPRCVLQERLSENSCAAHMWGGSWTGDEDRYWRARALFESSGDVEEADEVLADARGYLARTLRRRLSATRRARALAERITRPLEVLSRPGERSRPGSPLRWAAQVLRRSGSQVICMGPRTGRLLEDLTPALADSPATLHWDDPDGLCEWPSEGPPPSTRGRNTVMLVDAARVTIVALACWGRRDRIGLIQFMLLHAGPHALSLREVQRALGKAYRVVQEGDTLTAVRREVARASHTRRYVVHGVRTAMSDRPGFALVESFSERVVRAACRCAWIGAAAFERLKRGVIPR